MCGGHKAVEGVSRTVRTAGEVEPCRLEVKAQAPIRKFAAMRDLVSTIDCLVHEMKKKTNSLSGLFERSDAMVGVYSILLCFLTVFDFVAAGYVPWGWFQICSTCGQHNS